MLPPTNDMTSLHDDLPSSNLPSSSLVFYHSLDVISVPNSFAEAYENPRLRAVMDEEMEAMRSNNTRALTPLPAGKKVVGCRWTYAVKHKSTESVDKFKARLVTKGYTQTREDFHETFFPMVKLNFIRILLSIAVNLDWLLYQLDVKNAFLHNDLEEEVFIQQLPRYVAEG